MNKTINATVHTTCFGVLGAAWNVELRGCGFLMKTVQVEIALSSMALHGVLYRLGGGLPKREIPRSIHSWKCAPSWADTCE